MTNSHENLDTSDLTSAFRAIDANANRATEGLRVVEDYLRFHRNDIFLTHLSKQLRHDLVDAISEFTPDALATSRSTTTDVGSAVQTEQEYQRTTLGQVAFANLHRAMQATRTLEEFSKLVLPTQSQRFESIRYRLYTLEKAIAVGHSSTQRLARAKLYVLVDLSLGHGPVLRECVKSVLAAGVNVIQLRDKQATDRELIAAGRVLREVTREVPSILIVNDRPDIAHVVHADGVHVGQDELTVAEARQVVGVKALVGVSAHSIEQAREAVLDGANYLGIGPTFASTTKPFDAYPGLAFIRQVAHEITLPTFAIGGIDANNVSQVIQAGIPRVAIGAAIWLAEKPSDVAQTVKQTLELADQSPSAE